MTHCTFNRPDPTIIWDKSYINGVIIVDIIPLSCLFPQKGAVQKEKLYPVQQLCDQLNAFSPHLEEVENGEGMGLCVVTNGAIKSEQTGKLELLIKRHKSKYFSSLNTPTNQTILVIVDVVVVMVVVKCSIKLIFTAQRISP